LALKYTEPKVPQKPSFFFESPPISYGGKIEKFLNSVVLGDAYDAIKLIPDNSVQVVITSPPYYKQRNYGYGIGNESTPELYIGRLVDLVKECIRVIKPEGSIVFNLGDKFIDGCLQLLPYRFAIEVIQRTPLKLVNEITWVKTNPTPRQFKRRLIPSTEPFFHFVKSDHYYYNLNAFVRNESQRAHSRAVFRKGASMGQRYFRLVQQASMLTPQQKEMARKELEEVIAQVARGEIQSFRMKIRGIHKPPFGGLEGGRKTQLETKGFTIIKILGNHLTPDVIYAPVETLKYNVHPAVFPAKIIQALIRLLSRDGDVILDPFMGSGTTGVAALRENRYFIGFEINPEYCSASRRRIEEEYGRLAKGLFFGSTSPDLARSV